MTKYLRKKSSNTNLHSKIVQRYNLIQIPAHTGIKFSFLPKPTWKCTTEVQTAGKIPYWILYPELLKILLPKNLESISTGSNRTQKYNADFYSFYIFFGRLIVVSTVTATRKQTSNRFPNLPHLFVQIYRIAIISC